MGYCGLNMKVMEKGCFGTSLMLSCTHQQGTEEIKASNSQME